MNAPVILSRLETVTSLRHSLTRAKDERHKTRIRAIINIKEGATNIETARRFVVDPDTIRSWITTYNKGGTDALDLSRGGRPEGNPKWNQAIFEELVREIDKGGRYWSIPLMVEWLKEHHKEDVPESTVWYHIDRLDYSHKSARPHPYKGNKERQETFKKGAS